MLDFFYTLGVFIVAISLLIAVHEFGHFWVAKRLGVKVLRYSIGFGKPLWKRSYGPDSTEYIIAVLPIGGYVKMLDEREGEVAVEERHRAFNRQSLAKRFAIVFAGPAFNFLFAIFVYWLMFGVGVTGIKSVVGDVVPDSPAAQAGIKAQQEIIAVEGQETPLMALAMEALLPALLDRTRVTLQIRDIDGLERDILLDLSRLDADLEPREAFKAMGIVRWLPEISSVIANVSPDSPAAKAGFKPGDKIVRIDGVDIGHWEELAKYISARPEQQLNFVVLRGDEQIRISVRPAKHDDKGKVVGRIGISPKYESIPEGMLATHSYSFFRAIGKSFVQTWDKTLFILKSLVKLVTGEISIKNLSGPIGIAVYAGYSASAGLGWFLDFLGKVSISLGILNLLPIPILDGGHLLYYVIEFFKGSPVSENMEALGLRIGIILLVMLMSIALYNDILQLLGS